jgi:hypothetical protein
MSCDKIAEKPRFSQKLSRIASRSALIGPLGGAAVEFVNEDPLDILTYKVRLATALQLRDRASKSTLDRKVRERWFVKFLPFAKVPPACGLGGPLAWHHPGEDRWSQRPPQDIVREARERWDSIQAKTVPVYVATPMAAQHTGGVATGELRQPLQVSHDLRVTSVYLFQNPKVRAAWRGEDILRAEGWDGIVPDALVEIDGQRWAFEVIGESYTVERVRELQQEFARQGFGYQLF